LFATATVIRLKMKRLRHGPNRLFGRWDISTEQEIGEEGGMIFGGLIADPSSYVPGGVEVIRPGW